MKKILGILLILLIIGAVIFGWLFKMVFISQNGDSELKTFVIEQGQGVNQISINLKEQDLIDNNFVFETYVWLRKSEEKIIAGEHKLSGHMSVHQLLNNLMSGNTITNERNITIIEGWNLRDIGFYLENQGIAQAEELWELVGFPAVNYNLQTDLTKPQDFSAEFILLKNKPDNISYEGYLFPDTYRVFQDASVEEIVLKMFANFENKITQDMLNEINQQGKTLFDVITLASIVEKEGDTFENKKKVAGVYYNRLEIGMALQADPTVNYVTGKSTDRPSLNDIETDNFYNTYQYPGLPPGPICNPGLDSIKAVIYPDVHDHFFFINTPDGEMIFANTFEQHIQNRQRYLED